jgi:hypothetical protein
MSEVTESDSFVLVLDDVKALDFYPVRYAPFPLRMQRRHPGWVYLVMVALGLGGFGLVWAGVPPPQNVFFGSQVASGMFGFLLACGIHSFLLYRERWQKGKAFNQPAQQWKHGPWRVILTPEGIRQESSQASLFHTWSAIWAIDGTYTRAFFFTSEVEAIIVPRRAFASDMAFVSFVLQACRYWEETEAGDTSGVADSSRTNRVCIPQFIQRPTRPEPDSTPTLPGTRIKSMTDFQDNV